MTSENGGRARPHFKLYYFPVRNLAEVSRMILHYVNQPFDDIRVEMSEWPMLKPKMPYGHLPVLELEDSRQLGESHAIARYLARRFGLAGKVGYQEAKLNEIADYHKDVVKAISPYCYAACGIYPGDLEKLRDEVLLVNAEQHFPIYERMLGKDETHTGYLANSTEPTYVDFLVADYMFTIKGLEPDVMNKKRYPAIIAHMERVFNNPRLKKYIESRPTSKI